MSPEDVRIVWISSDGAEHEEHWPSPDTFVNWAAAQGLRGHWTAYHLDEDGDWVIRTRGRLP
jgi:hypothetical protein